MLTASINVQSCCILSSLYANNCVLYSTYVLTTHHSPKNDNNCIWRYLKHTEYWTKSIWIIPIHHLTQEHWVLCIVNQISKHVDFFDSLAQQSEWMNDIKVSITPLPPLLRLTQFKNYTTGHNVTHFTAGTHCYCTSRPSG